MTRTAHERPWQRRALRVPREDEALLALPPLRDTDDLLRRNEALFADASVNIQGRTLAQVRHWTRTRALEAARDYTAGLEGQELEGPEPEDWPSTLDPRPLTTQPSTLDPRPVTPLVVTGHQPSLFHPGVWAKNFAAGAIAGRAGGVGLSLVVDNDLLSTARIRIPVGDRDRPAVEMVPFDEDRPAGPWEEAHVLNRELFGSFSQRVVEAMSAWGIDPLIRELWPDALAQLNRSTLLRDGLTAARHVAERRWGLANLELPLSRLCELDPFLWFTGHLLAHLPRFRDVHNQVLVEYREVNRIRSRTHPVADLNEIDGWLEAPLWIWHKGDRQRGRVFAKQIGREVHLSDGRDVFARLKLAPEMDACCAVEGLRELPGRGIRLRTRALTTTLFARLCLADLFIHGIGGAKYDEMTDRIVARFFDLPAPEFLTVSATVYLPLAEPFGVTAADERRLLGLLRDLEQNPDRHIEPGISPEADALIAERQRLIAEQHAVRGAGFQPAQPGGTVQPGRLETCPTGGLTHGERRQRSRTNYERWRRFREINRQLAAHVEHERRRLERRLEEVRAGLEANGILQDREFAFCLYPAERLRSFLTTVRHG